LAQLWVLNLQAQKSYTMKKIYTLIISLGIIQMTFSQVSTNYNAKWFFGINSGTTWQTTDVKNQNNWGWGLTLGKSFNYNAGSLVSWDVRGRFLRGFWYGQDTKLSDFSTPNTTLSQDPTNYKDTFGYAVHNFQTENYLFNLELVLHANRLRERTRWDAYFFGGIGLNWNQTYGDYLNTDALSGDQSLYAWNVNNLNKSDIKKIQDGVYETALDGSSQNSFNFNASSSLGFGLGYQVGKAVTIGLEHKTTFAQIDRFDGFISEGKYKQDIYHYTSAYIQFRLFGRNDSRQENRTNPINPPVTQNENMPPIVTYSQPSDSGTEVSNPNYIIQANITNVFDKENVTFTQNGVYHGDFIYNTKTDLFSSNVVLEFGQNIFVLNGSNQYGYDTKTTIIIYKRELETPPVVTFLQPGSNPIAVNNVNFNIIGRVLNVKLKEQIQIKVNNQIRTNFIFNAGSGQVEFPIVLNQGSNTVEIKGTNAAGTDTKLTTIILREITTIEPPLVYFTDPSNSPTTVSRNNFTIKGKVLNVESNQNIVFKQNGAIRANFNFNPATDEFVCTVVMNPGQNIFELYGTNAAGTASDQTVIVYERAAPKPPVVTISNPNASPASTNNANYQFVGTVLNVTSKSQVSFQLNGQTSNGFTFNSNNGSVVSNLVLNSGVNTITLKGTNADGTDSKDVALVYRPAQTTQSPLVTYIAPSSNPKSIVDFTYPVQASVTNVSSPSGISIICNSQNITVYNFSNGLLSFNLNLIQGANVLTVIGSNAVGSDSKTTTIIYQPAATILPPVVNFINPASNPSFVQIGNSAVQANILNVASKSDISVKINGISTNNFTYSTTSKMVNFNTSLIIGANSIEIKGTNSAGTDLKTTTIIFREPIDLIAPTVTITQPNTSPLTVNNKTYTVLADITEVTNTSQVIVQVNGNAVSGYSVNIAQQKIVFPMNLTHGNNVILITVTTNTGSDSDTKTINYQKPVVVIPPTIIYTSPNSSGTTIEYNQFTMSSKVLAVDTKQQIILKKDGQVVNSSAYSFNAPTNTLSYPLTLMTGNNIFEITASNDGGMVSSTTNITYRPKVIPCDKPVIDLINPTSNGQEVDSSEMVFQFKVTGVTSPAQVQYIFNGASIINDGRGSANYSISTTLKKGNNTLEVISTNTCGETHLTTVVNYKPKDVPCLLPLISPIAPAAQNTTTENAGILVQLGFVNITNANQIIMKVNNQFKTFDFDAAQCILTTEANLNVGLNIITIVATNTCGSTTYTYNVTKIACSAPNMSLIYANVTNNQRTFASSILISLSLTEIDNNNQIQVTLNNKPIAFNLSTSTNILEVNYGINIGLSVFKIIVTNNCGTKVYVHSVAREKAPTRNAPTVSITNPENNSTTVNSGLSQITFSTTDVTDDAELILTVNGQNIAFSFDRFTNSGTATINLQAGTNIVTITALNPVGSANATATIIYSSQSVTSKPDIFYTSPKSSPSTINIGLNKIKGTVSNLNSSNDLKIKVNGLTVNRVSKIVMNNQTEFTFDINAVVSSPIYVIEVTATNGSQRSVEIMELRLNVDQIKEREARPVVKPEVVTPRGGRR